MPHRAASVHALLREFRPTGGDSDLRTPETAIANRVRIHAYHVIAAHERTHMVAVVDHYPCGMVWVERMDRIVALLQKISVRLPDFVGRVPGHDRRVVLESPHLAVDVLFDLLALLRRRLVQLFV